MSGERSEDRMPGHTDRSTQDGGLLHRSGARRGGCSDVLAAAWRECELAHG